MAFARTLILFTLTIIGSSQIQPSQPGQPIPPEDQLKIQDLSNDRSFSSCEFYLEFAKVFNYCGDQGYPLQFGYPYCSKFLEARDTFQTKEWVDNVRFCLEDELFQSVSQLTEYPSCKQIHDWGFNSHVKCYLTPKPSDPELSWCNLPFQDMLKVLNIAKGELYNTVIQGVPVILKCLRDKFPHLMPQVQ